MARSPQTKERNSPLKRRGKRTVGSDVHSLPADVLEFRDMLNRNPDHVLHVVAEKLVVDTPDLRRMWRALERRRTGNGVGWVWSFLHSALSAARLPAYFYQPRQARQKLARDILFHARELAQLLKESELDRQITLAEEGSGGFLPLNAEKLKFEGNETSEDASGEPFPMIRLNHEGLLESARGHRGCHR